jgi:hypothetical protein
MDRIVGPAHWRCLADSAQADPQASQGRAAGMSLTDAARSWWQDEPDRLAAEQAAMAVAAPHLAWVNSEPSGGWQGTAPLWPFCRPQPAGLSELVGGPLAVRVICGHAFPMVEPAVRPLSVGVPFRALGWTSWHVTPTGMLCLLQESAQWDPSSPAAALVPKISGWHIEFWLMRAGHVETMTECGISEDDILDGLLDELGRRQ